MRSTALFLSAALLLAASASAFDEARMLCLVNGERQRYGLRNLGLDGRLNDAAYYHCQWQADYEEMTHNGDGTPADRVDGAGYYWTTVAENVAYGYEDEEECMDNWMQSPGHRKNILGDSYSHFGCAVAYSSRNVPYYTQNFASDGSRQSYPSCPGRNDYDDYGGGRGDDDRYGGGRGGGRGGNDRYEGGDDDWYDDGGNDDWYDGGNDNWYDGGDEWYDDGGNDEWYDASGGGDEWYDDGGEWYDDGGEWYDDGGEWYDDGGDTEWFWV